MSSFVPAVRDSPSTPEEVVEAFLAALAVGDAEAADSLIADDIDYVNVGLPPVRGRREMAKVFALLENPASGFEVYVHAFSAEGTTVLTERTDVLLFGPLRVQFWVWGRFEVVDGRIALWRDSFDFVDITRGLVRGLAALVVPALAPAAPSGPDAAPGR